MSNAMKHVIIDIFVPDYSFGLMHDADVIINVINDIFDGRVQVRKIAVTAEVYNAGPNYAGFPGQLGEPGHIALFIEHAFVSEFIHAYKETAVFINPEWFDDSDKLSCGAVVNTILHKTRHYHATLGSTLSPFRHIYTGFTSIDPGVSVDNYGAFSHFRGKSPHRHTQNLIDIWRSRPDFPPLRVQAYGDDISLNTHAWAKAGNMEFYFGELDREVYFRDLARGGIHLCTTQVEGFGHILNEARAMSALVIALDAPPMNELITPETGILVPARATDGQRLGTVYTAEIPALVRSIEQALEMPLVERERIGRSARALYEHQAREFKQRLHAYLQAIVDKIVNG